MARSVVTDDPCANLCITLKITCGLEAATCLKKDKKKKTFYSTQTQFKMGKSAKFYKRPSKKEKEGNAIKKTVEASPINKKGSSKKAVNVPAAMFQDKYSKKNVAKKEEDVDMDKKPEVVEKKSVLLPNGEVPDYVDLFSGKKTYKKIPIKRK